MDPRNCVEFRYFEFVLVDGVGVIDVVDKDSVDFDNGKIGLIVVDTFDGVDNVDSIKIVDVVNVDLSVVAVCIVNICIVGFDVIDICVGDDTVKFFVVVGVSSVISVGVSSVGIVSLVKTVNGVVKFSW